MLNHIYRILVCGTLVLVAGGFLVPNLEAQTSLREIPIDNTVALSPVSVTVAPSGDRFAVSDQQSNSILVFDQQGRLQWTTGTAIPLRRPAAVCFTGDADLLFSQQGELVIYHVAEQSSSVVDTVADLSTRTKQLKSIDRIIKTKDSSFLILDRALGEVVRFTFDWKFDRVVVTNGQSQGEVWAPTDMVIDASGDIIVADAGPQAVQSFSSDGVLQFSGGWNAIDRNQVWEACSVAVSPLQVIWAGDEIGKQWRLFDRSGTETMRVPFPNRIFRPVATAITPGQLLIVLDEHSGLSLFSVE